MSSSLCAVRTAPGRALLLHALARPTDPGVVFVEGHDIRRLRRRDRRRAIALVPEAFDDLLFATTVAQECRRADRRSGGSGAAQLFAGLIEADPGRLAALLKSHPRDLSAGERLCLVLAIQLSAHPRVLLVDEPSRGLDAAARRLVGDALIAATASGAAVMMATHDEEFAARYATRTIAMAAGRIQGQLTGAAS